MESIGIFVKRDLLVCALRELQLLGLKLFCEFLHDRLHPMQAYKMCIRSVLMDRTK